MAGATVIELAPIGAVFSLSPRGTSGERGASMLTAGTACKKDGPPLPSPLLPPLRRAHSAASGREERESALLPDSMAVLAGPTAIELAPIGAVFSLSLRGTSGERAGERGASML